MCAPILSIACIRVFPPSGAWWARITFAKRRATYHRDNPSRSGDLLHVGRGFPAYLATLHRADQYRYLADVARLEWLCEESLLAAEHAALDMERLRGVAPSAYGALRFDVHPALRLFESPFPALHIWEANVTSDAEPEPIDLGAGADRLAITRVRLKLAFHRLSRGEFSFLDSLRGGDDFSRGDRARRSLR